MASKNENYDDLPFFEVINAKNKPFSAIPSSLKFCYNVSSSKEIKELKLTNVTSVLQRLFILPPLTKYFKITHPEKGWIAPGLSVLIKVTFEPFHLEKARHYKDCIRVMCDVGESILKKDLLLNQNAVLLDDSLLSIPITAEPHNPHCSLPDEIHFGCLQLGKKAVSTFEISPQSGQKIIFFIFVPQKSANFSINPLHGILNENDPPVVITVTFTPTEYKIMKLPIQVCIPSSSVTPYSVLLTGICKPWPINQGSEVKRKHTQVTNNEQFKRGQQQSIAENHSTSKQINPESSIKRNKNKIESHEVPLNTIHGVAKFLSHKPIKEKDPYFDLIGPLGKYQDEEKAIVNELENKFLSMVKKEKQRLRHISFSGEIALGPSPDIPNIEELAEIEVERVASHQNYQELQKIIEPEILFNNNTEFQLRRRVLRNFNEIPELKVTTTPNDMWFPRYQILSKFIQSVRKVIIWNRLTHRLVTIKSIAKNYSTGEDADITFFLPLLLSLRHLGDALTYAFSTMVIDAKY